MEQLKELPVNTSSFNTIIDSNSIYVDKTDLIAKLAKKHYTCMLTRPRGFGKTTLVNTLHELFANGLEKFKGLKIERDGLYTDTKTYKVLHLDFSECTESDDFDVYLRQALIKEFERNGIAFDAQEESPTYLLSRVLMQEPHNSMVLLIDNYDAPFTSVLNNAEVLEHRKSAMHSFYATLKANSNYLRFKFLTGVTRYQFGSWHFASFHIDQSLDPEYGALLGFTQEELESYFGDHIERAVCELNRVNNTDQYSYESVLQLLEQHYKGYRFDLLASTSVYNPWSVLNFLKNPSKGFQDYWVKAGEERSQLLVKYLGLQFGARFQYESFLDPEAEVGQDVSELLIDMVPPDSKDFPFEPMLMQTGYLTIKSEGELWVDLRVPNLEVGETYASIILDFLDERIAANLGDNFKADLQAALEQKQFEAVKVLLNQLVSILYEDYFSGFREGYFRGLFGFALRLAGASHLRAVAPNAVDPRDLVFTLGDTCLACELKLASNLSEVGSKLAEAEQQILAQDYTSRIGVKNVVPLAIVVVYQNETKDTPAVRKFEVIKPLDRA